MDFDAVVRQLLAGGPGEGSTAKDVAERGARAHEKLAKHLARLVGDTGIATLWKRSLAVAGTRIPWLASSATLREAMEEQSPEDATEGFVVVFSTFVGLLTRLIGEGLVERLVAEVWPEAFAQVVKETP